MIMHASTSVDELYILALANNNFLLRSRMRRELCLMQKGYSMVTLDALLCSV